jgi:hypothetical protein
MNRIGCLATGFDGKNCPNDFDESQMHYEMILSNINGIPLALGSWRRQLRTISTKNALAKASAFFVAMLAPNGAWM